MINVLVITPVKHIPGVTDILESIGKVTYLEDPCEQHVADIVGDYHALFTNPNKSKVFIGNKILEAATQLEVICTASTGTNHIDLDAANAKKIKIISLTEQRETINKISSTAELAFALMLASLRQIVPAFNSVLKGEWDYEKFIGRQVNMIKIAVIGYGRLGSMFAEYCKAFGASVYVYDPYKVVDDDSIVQVHDIYEAIHEADVIALHVHVTNETYNFMDKNKISYFKDNVILVNTSRGDIVNEDDLVEFLKINPCARVATDVFANEIQDRTKSPLYQFSKKSNQVLVTPHIGGMTIDAQKIAYGQAAALLKKHFNGGFVNYYEGNSIKASR